MIPERTAQSYGPAITTASKSVLLEVLTTLRSYQGALVLIGGWVPYFLLEQHRPAGSRFAHVGSIDIDLAVDPATVQEPEYATIVELLLARGYQPVEGRRSATPPSSFERTVNSAMTHKPYTIRVDFLAPQDDAQPARPRHVAVQDGLMARKIKGCQAALTHKVSFPLSGRLPEGGEITVPVSMADLVAILAMKGIVLGERYREKDAYDIYALIKHYEGGPRAVADALRPHLADPLIREAVEGIRAAFASRQAHGPAWAAAFLVHAMFSAEHQRLMTDAFMVVNECLTLLHGAASGRSRSGSVLE